jgi:long-chain acyl-CoA synthetase
MKNRTASSDDTLPGLLFKRAAELNDHHALREKEFGIWQSISWADYAKHVRQFACGLKAIGVQREDTVAIIGDNRPEWLYSEFAAQSIGARSFGVYQDSVANEVKYLLQASDTKVVVVEDQEQVDKILEIWGELDGVLKVIYYYAKGMRNYREDFLVSFSDVEAMGEAWDKKNHGAFELELAAVKPDDIAMLSTTSGTTGRPKLAMLSHRNMIAQGIYSSDIDDMTPEDEYVSFLPLAWIGEQLTSVSRSVQNGFAINFPESAASVQQNIREIGPSVMFSPPRIWENMLSTVQVKIDDTTPFKRKMYDWAMKIGNEYADARFSKSPISSGLKFRYKLANALVLEELKDQLGLRHIKRAYTGGAALGPDVFRFYHGMGVNLKQVYGQTESAGLSCIHHDDQIKFQTVGPPLPGTQIKVLDSGEICVKSDAIFKGYYKNPQATAEALHDGWLMTGDAGYFDEDGHLVVIDRAKDVMTLHDGTKFSPQFIENKLKFSQYVREAVVFGGDIERNEKEFARSNALPFVSAFINIDFGNVGKWAENNKIGYTTYTDLAQKPEVYKLIRKEVERTNADLPEAAKIKRFVLLHKELDADDAELTRTRKVRRGFIARRYLDIVEAMYTDQTSIPVESVITYQDGRTAKISTKLHVEILS